MQTGTIAFLFGVLWLQLQPTLPAAQWLFAASLLPLLVMPLHKRLALLLAALLAGALWALLVAQQRLDDALPVQLEGEEVVVLGQIVALPECTARYSRFLFAPQQLSHGDKSYPPPRLLRLNWYEGAPELRPGQRWQLTVKLKRPWGMMNPGGFDYEQWLFQSGVRATGYVRTAGENRLLESAHGGVPLQRLRYDLQQRLERALADSAHGGIIQALAIGERAGIEDGEWAVLLATGTNHLVAISGLHVGLVAGLLFLLMRRLWALCPRCTLWLAAPRAAALIALLGAVIYAAMAGFSVPTQRAMLMLALVMGAIFWQRPIESSRLLALVALLVVGHDPMVVLAPGFWLSFGAVALILYGMRGRLNPGGVWWRWGRVQWLVAVGLAPLLLLLFGQAAVVAPLANLVAVPWIGLLVVPLTLLGALLLMVWEAGGFALLQGAAWLTGLLWPLLTFLAETLPALRLAVAPWWSYLLALSGVVWLLAPRGWPLRWAGVVPLLPLLLWQPPPLAQGEARFTLLDVGQGLVAVVQTRSRVAVFDTGPYFPSGFNTGSAVVVPFLRQQGLAALDTLIISHGDNDHIGGARALAQALPPHRVLTSVPEKMGWIAHESCRRGERWQWDGVEFELLHPVQVAVRGRGNNDSCVLRVSVGGESLLLTGDIELAAERELLAHYGARLQADILVAPHHGSKSSSSEPFIAAVAPRWVLFPLGYRNRYGFPHPSVSERYRQGGVTMLTSSASGAISFILGRGALLPEEQRKTARRYWHVADL
ncbi:MAG: DNA internalization-related competence protein ComEC/Rec2 [Gammaproteobacteria bacterium]|nr:DNA internalization-related competence protein ComEC/Rec2 [Gammaproteobacteria bacterium]